MNVFLHFLVLQVLQKLPGQQLGQVVVGGFQQKQQELVGLLVP